MSGWYCDPLLVKEFRTRLRARTATVAVLLQSLVLCVLAGLFFLSQYGSPAWEVGENLFHVLLYTQTMILFFLAPLVAASVISGEKEQKTYDSLLVTPASPQRIVITKLLSALAVFMVLLAIALPFVVAAYLLGGVPFGQLVLGWLYVLLLMSVSGVMGLYWSTRFERSIASIPAAAICTVLLGVLYPLIASEAPAMLARISPVLFLRAFLARRAMPFFGLHVPGWLLVFVFFIFCGGAFASAAIERVKVQEDRRYFCMRGFSLLALTTLATGFVGGLAGDGAMPNDVMARSSLGGILFALLIPLCCMAPWLGASMPVIRSSFYPVQGTNALLSRLSVLGRLLTGPIGYPALLGIVGMGLVFVARSVLGLGQDLPGYALPLCAASLVVCPVTYSMLTYRFADRLRVRNRFIGLGVACVLIFVILVVPLIFFFVGRVGVDGAPRSLLRDIYALTSPFTTLTIYGSSPRHAWLQTFSGVRGRLGDAGLWAIAPVFHLMLLGILALPVFPSWTRKWKAGIRGRD